MPSETIEEYVKGQTGSDGLCPLIVEGSGVGLGEGAGPAVVFVSPDHLTKIHERRQREGLARGWH